MDVPEAELTELRRTWVYLPPRSWAQKAYPNLVHFNKVAKGGHFAAWEQPKIFTDELRAGFRSLRG